ncbi:MAG: flagellar filament capping protein FliD [Planctomycetes bacterium]|nr:flagellar filament capping protein FliD [Planctomycetota bacterium]
MSTAGISFGGLASGLDTQAIISALVAVEQRPIFQLEKKESDLKKQKSLFGDLNGLLDKLTEAAKKLKTTSSFLQMSAKSSNEDILTASASSTAAPGTYQVEVERLASGQINKAGAASSSDPIANTNATVTLQIDAGGESYFITADNDFDSIATAINQQSEDSGVRAEVIDTGSGNPDPNERYQLVLRSVEPGSENSFTLTADDGGPGFDALVTTLNTNETAAQDAKLIVNGIEAYRSTNTISDLFAGITLDLKSASAETVTITVATDGEETSSKVKDLVNAYNELVDFFEAQNKVDEEGNTSSPLFGDTTLRSIRSSLRGIVGGSVSGTGNEAYQLLSQIGITADTKGKLEFNQSKFEEALSTDESAVTALFSDGATGIAKRLENQIDLYTDSVDGLIKTRNDGFDRRIKQTKNRIEDAERRLTLYEERLTKKYANLETLLTRLQGQGSSIGNIAQP